MFDMNNILKSLDNLLKSIDNNKNILILILILLGIYYTYYNSNVVKYTMYLFDNEIFKFSVFIIITYISSSSPAIGIGLALIMFVSLQIITYIKLKNELNNNIDSIIAENNINKENFSSIEPSDILHLNDEYLTNPLEKIKQLAPPINFNLKLESPKELSYQMIKQGKTLLNDSFDLEQDSILRYDSREKQIAFETQRNGKELVDSGINRLQMANQGEYKTKSHQLNKYIKLMGKTNPLIDTTYNGLLYNYNQLVNNDYSSSRP